MCAVQEEGVKCTITYLVVTSIERSPQPNTFVGGFCDFGEAPATLCQAHKLNEPPPDATAFVDALFDNHNIFLVQNWSFKCIVCGRHAGDRLLVAKAMISPTVDRSAADFKPSAVCLIAPICLDKWEECGKKGQELLRQERKKIITRRTMEWFWLKREGPPKKCDTCGRESSVKSCSGCKQVA